MLGVNQMRDEEAMAIRRLSSTHEPVLVLSPAAGQFSREDFPDNWTLVAPPEDGDAWAIDAWARATVESALCSPAPVALLAEGAGCRAAIRAADFQSSLIDAAVLLSVDDELSNDQRLHAALPFPSVVVPSAEWGRGMLLLGRLAAHYGRFRAASGAGLIAGRRVPGTGLLQSLIRRAAPLAISG